MPDHTVVYLFQGLAGESVPDPLWYWHVKAANGEIVAASKSGELTEELARFQIENLVDVLWDNVEPDYTEDSAGEWRWSISTQGELRGRSSEGFVERSGAQENFELAKTMLTRRLEIEARESSGE